MAVSTVRHEGHTPLLEAHGTGAQRGVNPEPDPRAHTSISELRYWRAFHNFLSVILFLLLLELFIPQN